MIRVEWHLVAVMIAAIGWAGAAHGQTRAKAGPLVLEPGMEWSGTFSTETVRKNAAYMTQSDHKIRGQRSSPCRLLITDVDKASVSGEFHWGGTGEQYIVKFKGSATKRGQFQFAFTEQLKGNLDHKVDADALTGSFGPKAESISGAYSSTAKRLVGEFNGELKSGKLKSEKTAEK